MPHHSAARRLTLGALIYDGVEPLDLFGPLEMWMNLGPDAVGLALIAESKRPVSLATAGWPLEAAPQLMPQYDFDDAPALDLILVPGGMGSLREVENERLIAWLRERGAEAQITASVCTGAQLLAQAGLLDGRRATGNKMFFSYVASFGPQTQWEPSARWVDEGDVATSSGVSAGIDLMLSLIARLFGPERARQIAAGTEYEWREDPTDDPFSAQLDQAMPYLESLR